MLVKLSQKLIGNIKGRKLFFVITFFVSLKIVIAFIFTSLSNIFYNKDINENFFSFDSKLEEFILVCIFAPIIETALFQYIPYKFLKFLKAGNLVIIFISALLFALAHNYNYLYMANAFFGGTLLSFCYISRVGHKPFVCVMLIHSIYNLFAFVNNNFDNLINSFPFPNGI